MTTLMTPPLTSSQSTVPVAKQEGERLLVVRLSAMGDIIHGMPAVAALRQARPDLRIGWLIEERWADLLCTRSGERFSPTSAVKPLADWVHVANFSIWKRALFSDETWREMRKSRQEVRSMHYHAALDLQGAIRSSLTARLSGARERIGSSCPREGAARLWYTRHHNPGGAHVVDHALSLASVIAGQPLAYAPPPFPVDDAIEAWADALQDAFGGAPLAIVNPGAGWGAKCWSAESFGRVARELSARGLSVLLNHGPGEEPLVEAVLDASGNTAHKLSCSVGELIAVTRRAKLFVGGDTGPMHLAAALGVPIVALFGPTQPERNGPYGTRSIILRSPESINNSSHTHQPDEGLLSITPEAVMEAARRLLAGNEGGNG